MHYTHVKMKDGTTYEAPIWYWRPREDGGWFSLMHDEGPDRIMLDDVASAFTENVRVNARRVDAKRNDLVRAVQDGWTPKDPTPVGYAWEDVEEVPADAVVHEGWDGKPQTEWPLLDEAADACRKDQKVVRVIRSCGLASFYIVPKGVNPQRRKLLGQVNPALLAQNEKEWK